MIGALSQYGKVGVICIGNSAEEAQPLFDRTTTALDDKSHRDGHGEATPLFDRFLTME
jgi:hypothetical protein